MKKCTYCGKEYPDLAVECLIDGEPLAGGESQVSSVGQEIAAPPIIGPLPPPLVSVAISPVPATPFTARQVRIIEIVLVCAVAFGSSILASTFYFFGLSSGSLTGGTPRWLTAIFHEAAALGLLWYVLMRRSKSFSDLGFSWAKKDLGRSILLWIAGMFAFSVIYGAIYFAGLTSTSGSAANARVTHLLFGGGVSFATIAFQFVNPFFEELIVRAYVMTELRHLTNSMSKAVILSTLLQMSYHFYQGAPTAIAEGAMFLVFSLYYGKTNRVAPIILAHLYSDVGGTLGFVFFHG